MYVLKVRSHGREELVEFTDQVREKLRESGAREGVVVLYVQHTTAGLTINENADPDVPRDMLHALRTLIPQHGMDFRHGEENLRCAHQGQPHRILSDDSFSRWKTVARPLAGNFSLRVRRWPRAPGNYDHSLIIRIIRG